MTKMMCFSARMELLRSVQMKYHDASWSEKAKILDGFVAVTDYDRKYAIRLLLDPETPVYLQDNVVHHDLQSSS